MKALILGACIALSCTALFAQKSPIKFGDIPLDDLKMTIYPLDSSAEAVKLCDYGEAYIQLTATGASLVVERHVRIKVLTKEGLDWANASIYTYDNGTKEENIRGLKAASYNLEEGKIVTTKLTKENIFKNKHSRYYNVQKFTIPNTKEGSVIEYSYTINSDFITNFPNWTFQSSIPTRHSEYWALFPEFFTFEKFMQGYIPITNYEVKDKTGAEFSTKAHHWTVKNIPAFKEEPFMTSEEDYISKINLALSYVSFPGRPVQEIMGSWQKLNQTLTEADYFGTVIEKSGFLKKNVETIIEGKTDPLEKLVAIHSWVKNNIEWDGVSDFYVGNLRKILEQKKGTSGDINLMLGSMLDKAGFSVEMVLLSTRDHGFIRETFPMESQFNYTICSIQIGDKTLLLDATEKYLPYTVLPERCLNGRGMVVSKTNHRWIDLHTKAKARTVITADLTLNDDGDLQGKLNYNREGYDAFSLRKSFIKNGQEEYLKNMLGSRPWEIEKSEFENIDEFDAAAKELYDLTIRDHIVKAGDILYINPFVTGQIGKNPFTTEKREYPVNYGKNYDQTYMLKLTVPEGYTVDELPPSKMLQLPGSAARYIYNVSQQGNTISITSSFLINRSLFTQDEYLNLREFYNQVVAKQAEQLVLKKKI